MIRGIIFDLDGVLCSTDEYHFQAWKELADGLGLPFDRQKNNRLRGVSRMASLELVLEDSPVSYSEDEKSGLADRKNRRYRELLESMTPADLPEEVRETLTELRKRGYLQAVGSSSRNAKRILSRIGLDGWFDAVSDGTNITHSKPHPEVFLRAAGMLGLPPEECLVVEDAAAGVEAAAAGGFVSAGLGEAASCPQTGHSLSSFRGLLDILPEAAD